MNNQQRQYLIKKIEASSKIQIEALKNSIPQPPSLNIYLLHAVMSNNFEIKKTDELKEMIRQMALKATEREDWMGNHWGSASKSGISFAAKDFFIVPAEFQILWDDYQKNKREAEDKIYAIHIQSDSLITRITLASDKTLQTLINEVDDMGNISLMDTKLKLLTS
jgi:hypothetical protein